MALTKEEYDKEMEEYRIYLNRLKDQAKKEGIVFRPLPSPPERGTSTYEKDVDAFIDYIKSFTETANKGAIKHGNENAGKIV